MQCQEWLTRAGEWADARLRLAGRRVPRLGQDNTPYATALRREAGRQRIRAQAPGHGGLALPAEFVAILYHYAHHDVSVMAGVDMPRVPGDRTPLQQAEALCAELYGASLCRFVTTGATHAAQAAALTLFETVGRDRAIAVQASCHISIIDALARTGAKVVIVPPRVSELGVATVLDPELAEQVLRRPDVGGLIVSTPSYEGAVGDMPRLVGAAHAQGKPVMIDNSWGSELGLTPLLPGSGIQAGADIVVGSPHKMLRAPGQSAWVFLSHNSLIPEVVFGGVVRAQLSTSKSSVFLAGLDIARHDAARNAGGDIWRSITTVAEEEARLRRNGLGHLVVDWKEVRHIPYRVVFSLAETGYTGYEVGAMLRELYGVQVAQANVQFVCCGFGVGADDQIRATFRAIERVVRGFTPRPPLATVPPPPLRLQEVDFSVVPGSGVELVPFREAIGRKAKYPVGGYPPGYCVLVPGADVTEDDVAYLEAIFELGAVRFGPPAEVPPGYLAVIRS